VYITLSGEETIMTSAHLCEGFRDELWFRKVIGMPEDVREGGRVGGEQSVAIEEATVCKGVADQLRAWFSAALNSGKAVSAAMRAVHQ
jgi:hypothetical protein